MLKKFLLPLIYIWSSSLFAQNNYFFGSENGFDNNIPSPEKYLGYPLGSEQTRYDQIVDYFKELDKLSEKANLKILGYTYENRPLVVLIITSPKNFSNLEQIRNDHLKVLDPSNGFDQNNLPVIDLLGYGVHGNESSGPEAAMLTAYYLVANESKETEVWLNHGIYFIDPSRNPDGHERHTVWVNSQKSKNLVSDPADLEHNEYYPGGRTNHYWFDLNRDWLPAVHEESRVRLRFYHSWVPHLATSHHEQGTNSTFFFEPTQIDNESPIIPKNHYKLNYLFADYIAESLDNIGSLYFTKEEYDNYNPTFGSSYPDYNGSLAILFEQGSSRGFIQEKTVGKITFAFAIRNQLAASLASIKASVELKEKLISNQIDFFKTAYQEAEQSPIKGYVFGDRNDVTRSRLFAEYLILHGIKVFENNKQLNIENQNFYPESSFVVPLAQSQKRLIDLIFNKNIRTSDSVFYDGSTWTVALAYGLPYAPVNGKQFVPGLEPLRQIVKDIPVLKEKSNYAYLIRWSDFNSPRALSELLNKRIIVYAATAPFTAITENTKTDFGYGTLVVPVTEQKISADELFQTLAEVGRLSSVEINPVNTGYNVGGIDLGSNKVKPLIMPEILLVTGQGTNSLEAGESWFVIDNHLNLPVTRIDFTKLSNINLSRYNVIILPGITPDFENKSGTNKLLAERIRLWVANGGTLLGINRASEWLIKNGIINERLITVSNDTSKKERLDYNLLVASEGSKIIGGTILLSDIDITHPIGFGFTNRKLPVLKNNQIAFEYSNNKYGNVAALEKRPLLSGYISNDNIEKLSEKAIVIVSPYQKGRVILYGIDPIHRASWYATERLFFNALFFGNLVNGQQVRYRTEASENE